MSNAFTDIKATAKSWFFVPKFANTSVLFSTHCIGCVEIFVGHTSSATASKKKLLENRLKGSKKTERQQSHRKGVYL